MSAQQTIRLVITEETHPDSSGHQTFNLVKKKKTPNVSTFGIVHTLSLPFQPSDKVDIDQPITFGLAD
jgi:hypothetical protein